MGLNKRNCTLIDADSYRSPVRRIGMAAAAVQNAPVTHASNRGLTKDAKCSGHRSSKAKRNASEKERLCLQTEEIVKGHILGGIERNRQYSAIHRCCSKVVEDNETNLFQLCKKLRPSRQSLHGNFMEVFGTLFSDGITVGKIVTSIAFGGKLVKYCTENDLEVTDNLIAWILDYFKHYLATWILNYGGWVR